MSAQAPGSEGWLGLAGQPWLKLAGAAVVGAGLFWAANKYAIPKLLKNPDDDDDIDDDIDDED